METKSCHHCGASVQGRADKKFCDDTCRTAFNNRDKHESPLMKNINKVLRNNRRILEELIPQKSARKRTSRRRLEERGFHFEYHTHIQPTLNGKPCFFCYEYGVIPIKEDHFVLIRKNR